MYIGSWTCKMCITWGIRTCRITCCVASNSVNASRFHEQQHTCYLMPVLEVHEVQQQVTSCRWLRFTSFNDTLLRAGAWGLRAAMQMLHRAGAKGSRATTHMPPRAGGWGSRATTYMQPLAGAWSSPATTHMLPRAGGWGSRATTYMLPLAGAWGSRATTTGYLVPVLEVHEL